MPPGGKRAGAGRPKGIHTQLASTLNKIQSREYARVLIMEEFRDMMAAQLANAKGIKYLVVRNKKTGKFARVGEALAKALADDDEETVEIWEKDPSVEAFKELMNRALDKPKEQEQEVAHTGTFVVKWENE